MPLEWHALHVTARQEKAAAADLVRRGFDVFLPSRRERRAWSDRVQVVELALFPGYLFVRTQLSPPTRVQLLKAKGVHGLVAGARDGRVPDEEMNSLIALCSAARALDPVDRLGAGVPVRVVGGPLRGVHGVVESGPDNHRRLVVQIALLGRGVRTQLLVDDVLEELEAVAA